MNSKSAYQQAGVNIDAGYELVDKIKPLAKATTRPEVLQGLGGFAGLFALDTSRYQQPVLVSGTDGVGTKLKLAIDCNQHDGIGIDLVAMCVNDILATGAEPLFFLDYFATSKLNPEQAATVIAGIAEGCKQSGAALLGGETAEMPGLYQKGDYDLAGFCVGVVEKDAIISGDTVREGDAIIGLASSGPHANGYSLIRKLIADNNVDLNQALAGKALSEHLLAPTKIYVSCIHALLKAVTVKAMAHITGGGFDENIPRALPKDLAAKINRDSFEAPPIFNWLAELGGLAAHDLTQVFNGGIGYVVITDSSEAANAIACLKQNGQDAWQIGQIVKKQDQAVVYG